jgi:hypothetical protein
MRLFCSSRFSQGTKEVQKLRKQGIIIGNERKVGVAETLYWQWFCV